MLFSNLTELLKHRPELAKEAAELCLNLDKEDNNYPLILATLVGAISSSNTKMAEIALTDLLLQKQDEKVSIQAAMGFNNFSSPSEKSVLSLETVISSETSSKQLKHISRLALGSVASFSENPFQTK